MFRIHHTTLKLIFFVGTGTALLALAGAGSTSNFAVASANAGAMTELKVNNPGFLKPLSITKGGGMKSMGGNSAVRSTASSAKISGIGPAFGPVRSRQVFAHEGRRNFGDRGVKNIRFDADRRGSVRFTKNHSSNKRIYRGSTVVRSPINGATTPVLGPVRSRQVFSHDSGRTVRHTGSRIRIISRSVLDGTYDNDRFVEKPRQAMAAARITKNRHSQHPKNYGMQAIAGERYHRTNAVNYPRGHNIRRFNNRLTAALLLIGLQRSQNPGMQQIAGNSDRASGADCAYGTYCTIDLGGPKIITFNDIANIEDGGYSDTPQSGNEIDPVPLDK